MDVVQWDYSAERGPARWGGLCADFALCDQGRAQSPIDISGARPADGPALRFDYRGAVQAIEHRGVSVALHFGEGCELRIGERAAQLTQAHWHTPAEHAVDGRRFPLEMHYVHVLPGGALAVVGVLYETGAPDPQLARILREIEPMAGAPAHHETRIPAAPFAPAATEHCAYDGSLTTPACNEGVLWHVMTARRAASPQQIAALNRLTGGDNSRPLQPRNDRPIARVA